MRYISVAEAAKNVVTMGSDPIVTRKATTERREYDKSKQTKSRG